MVITNNCPHCGNPSDFDHDQIGANITCPHCTATFRVHRMARSGTATRAHQPTRTRSSGSELKNFGLLTMCAGAVLVAFGLVGFNFLAALGTFILIAGFVLVIIGRSKDYNV